MRRAANIDRPQPAIVAALRAAGASVAHTHMIGHGFPDLVVGFVDRETGERKNVLLEIKDATRNASHRQLTQDEQAWHASWQGPVYVVESVDDALAAIGAI